MAAAEPFKPIQTHTTCPLCADNQALVVATVDGKTSEPLLTVSCEGCGLGRIDPLPSQSELEDWYKTQYRQAYKGFEKPKLKHVLRAGRNAVDRHLWLRQNHEALFARGALKTLDIGASSGEFVALMDKCGFDAHGIEPHEGYSEYARSMGLQVRNGSLGEVLASHGETRFDLITLFHVLEHLPEPIASLRQIGGFLGDEGRLYIEVPDATRMTSPTYMFFRAHTLYFDQASLAHTLQCAGYRLMASEQTAEGNLRVVGRYEGQPLAQGRVAHAHTLVQAQKRRRWAPYIMGQLAKGEPFGKLSKQMEEKRAASKFSHSAELLGQVYADYLSKSGR